MQERERVVVMDRALKRIKQKMDKRKMKPEQKKKYRKWALLVNERFKRE